MRRIAFTAMALVAATAFAGTLGSPEEAGNPACRAEKEKLLATAKAIIESLEQKNALLELKVAALEDEVSKFKSKSPGVK